MDQKFTFSIPNVGIYFRFGDLSAKSGIFFLLKIVSYLRAPAQICLLGHLKLHCFHLMLGLTRTNSKQGIQVKIVNHVTRVANTTKKNLKYDL